MTSTSAARDSRPASTITADILVVGGGAAGLAAAVAAGRRGLKVVLLERYGFCGGAAVAGLSGTICGLYAASTSNNTPPQQVVAGFADEFLRLMETRDGVGPAVRYGQTFTRVHDPLVWREAADHLLREASVTTILHATVTDALVDGGERIAGVIAYTKQGRLRVEAALTIDASGDADLFAMAGLPTRMGASGRVQNPTMIFRLQGVDVPAFLSRYGADSIMGADISELMTKVDGHGYDLPRKKIFLFPTPRPGELLCNATRLVGRDGRELNPLITADLTEAEIEGRRQVREYARFFRDHLAGCERAFVNDTGVQVGVRQTRQIAGKTILSNDDVRAGRKFATGIARSPWPIELHSGEKPKLEWLFDDVYEVPWECFVPEQGEGVLAAGRCLSAEHEAMASARVTAQCFGYGQAVGLAAAVCVRDRVAPRALDGREVRRLVNSEGGNLG